MSHKVVCWRQGFRCPSGLSCYHSDLSSPSIRLYTTWLWQHWQAKRKRTNHSVHSSSLVRRTSAWYEFEECGVIRALSRSWQFLQSYRDWNKVYHAQWLGLWTRSCLYVMCMYWTRLVLVRPSAASLYSASPLKHHAATGRQGCPNPDHYPESESASRSLTPLCWAPSSGRSSNHQPPACQANAQPLHCPLWVGGNPLPNVNICL